MTYLRRYLEGEQAQVWHELLLLGAEVRKEPTYSAALAVAKETMTRARYNLELLIPKLNELNYIFVHPKEILEPLQPEELENIARLEEMGYLLPLSFRSWLEVVGRVDFRGAHRTLSFYEGLGYSSGGYSDPLVVRSWWDNASLEETIGLTSAGINAIDLAPDPIRKAKQSGGEPYSLTIPNANVDANLNGAEIILTQLKPKSGKRAKVSKIVQPVTFVEYLRDAFYWGGFPGLRYASKPPFEELKFLTENLLPI